MMTPIRLCLIALVALTAAGACPVRAADLTVIVDHVPARDGGLRLRIFNSPDGFGDPDKAYAAALQFKPPGRRLSVTFPDLPPGRYAAITFFDPKGDGKIPTDAAGNPTVPVRLSGTAAFYRVRDQVLSGFDEASFYLDESGLTVELMLP